MSTFAFQKLLLQLYTNEEIRGAFFANPDAVARSYGLSKREERALASLPDERVRMFQAELRDKRRRIAAKMKTAAPAYAATHFFVFRFYRRGPAALCATRSGEKLVEIRDGQFALLNRLAAEKRPATPIALLQSYLTLHNVPPRDLFATIFLVLHHRLQKRYVAVV